MSANVNPERAADLIHSAAIHLLRHVAREDPASGLTRSRLSALSVVVYAGPIGLNELAAAEQVRPPTMTKIVYALEDAGLVQKRWQGRNVSLTATARGRKVLEQARRRRLAQLGRRLQRLESGEVETVARAAELIERALRDEQPPQQARSPARRQRSRRRASTDRATRRG
jgi:DNA-binding MarR family transcriptional regulator